VKFTAVDVPVRAGSVYRSERYDLVHKVVGFGIVMVEVWCRRDNRKLKEFIGHTALKLAMDWCHERERGKGGDAA
jgi:hypothetical protein